MRFRGAERTGVWLRSASVVLSWLPTVTRAVLLRPASFGGVLRQLVFDGGFFAPTQHLGEGALPGRGADGGLVAQELLASLPECEARPTKQLCGELCVPANPFSRQVRRPSWWKCDVRPRAA